MLAKISNISRVVSQIRVEKRYISSGALTGVTAQVAKTTDGKPASKIKCNYPWSHADKKDKIPWNTGLLYKFYTFL